MLRARFTQPAASAAPPQQIPVSAFPCAVAPTIAAAYEEAAPVPLRPDTRRRLQRRLALSFVNHIGAAAFCLYVLSALLGKTWFPLEAMVKDFDAGFEQQRTLNCLRARAYSIGAIRPPAVRPPLRRSEVEAILRGWRVQTRVVVPSVPASQHFFNVEAPPTRPNYAWSRTAYSTPTPPAGCEIVQYVWGDLAQQARDTEVRHFTDVWVVYKPDKSVLAFDITSSVNPSRSFGESFGLSTLYFGEDGGFGDYRPLPERPRAAGAGRFNFRY